MVPAIGGKPLIQIGRLMGLIGVQAHPLSNGLNLLTQGAVMPDCEVTLAVTVRWGAPSAEWDCDPWV
jgi:hypothetical protein